MAPPRKAATRGRARRRVRKNIAIGQAHIKTSFNNTIVALTDPEGNVIVWESAGSAGFKGSRKSTPFAAQVTADAAARKGMEHGLQKVEVFVKGPGSGRETAIRSLQAAGLETRLDNVVYRLGFAASRAQARQLVRHGHFSVNGRRVNIPSFQVRPDDVITLKSGSTAEQIIRDATDLTAAVAPWLQADHEGLTGKVLKWPEREEIDTPVQEQLIVELYSK